MPQKQFMLDEQTPITIYKRRASRSLRLSIAADGQVRVSIPAWAPYKSGLDFALSRRPWIDANQRQALVLTHGQAIGKAHHLNFVVEPINAPQSRVLANEIIVKHPADLSTGDPAVQAKARDAGVRALRSQAQGLLPQRLAMLAERDGFEYTSVRIKQLKSRWGSCDQQANITLNLFLMQLPWDCIDYVLLHELTHTKILRHGPDFWREMEAVLPNVKQVRKQLRNHQPVLS